MESTLTTEPTMTTSSEAITGVRDEHYDLISVLYHCLTEADTVERYIADAHDKGDGELAEFFTEVRDTDRARIARCKELLGTRIGTLTDT